MNSIDELAQIVWDYLKMNKPLGKADCILALGSHDVRVARRAADLYIQGMAPLVLCSGGYGRLTGSFPKPEAEVFADVAMQCGVPADKVAIENKSTNTGENIEFSINLLAERGVNPRNIILVTKPYMERRAYAAFVKRFPDIEVTPSSPLISFPEAAYDGFTKDDVINIMVGDLQRIKIYPSRGFQIPQDIPIEVWQAYQVLVSLGYTKQLVK